MTGWDTMGRLGAAGGRGSGRDGGHGEGDALVRVREYTVLFSLALIWGASFLVINAQLSPQA